MTTELFYLTLTTLLTGTLWIPYIVNRIAVRGLGEAMGYPDTPKPQSPWAQRLMKAHQNAVENLVVFTALVLVANAMEIGTESTAIASMVYFWMRLAHAVAFTFKIPLVRTFSFFISFGAQMVFVWTLLTA
ncbi:MAPEG family protein [Marinobacter confluentis]|uniref:MAPEG family protein n=1 Tax=Marinobacter confluentis TaxID=1697557 RepID=A0A4Z1C4R3_9GAMM|nr:MAPEG family protein [Marinobacter confluentis]TGN40260.1 MAPEG family protein [Marinobacter confluentis]